MVLVAILLILGLTSVTDRMRSSYERKSGSGSASSKGQGQLQFTSGRLSPSQSLELLRPQSSTTAAVGSRSGWECWEREWRSCIGWRQVAVAAVGQGQVGHHIHSYLCNHIIAQHICTGKRFICIPPRQTQSCASLLHLPSVCLPARGRRSDVNLRW